MVFLFQLVQQREEEDGEQLREQFETEEALASCLTERESSLDHDKSAFRVAQGVVCTAASRVHGFALA